MSKNNHEIVYEGWLTKSPPSKRIWRAKWRRRWFALRQSGDLPGQYFLDYYADRNCRRLKGTIDLDLCEQVDAGLHMERGSGTNPSPKFRGSVFSVRTQARTYHLEADSEADMEKWLDAICRVCGLRSTEDTETQISNFQKEFNRSAHNEEYEFADTTGPYIPISECITGMKMSNDMKHPKAFRFDIKLGPNKKSTTQTRRANETRTHPSGSEDSSDGECTSLTSRQHANTGPPVPPRPPNTFRFIKNGTNSSTTFQRLKEPQEPRARSATIVCPRSPSRSSCATGVASNSSTSGNYTGAIPKIRHNNSDEASLVRHTEYHNLPLLPPAVDRALKPRPTTSYDIPQLNHYHNSQGLYSNEYGMSSWCREYRNTAFLGSNMQQPTVAVKREALQYLDLDLHQSKPPSSVGQETIRRPSNASHNKSLSEAESESAYKTVDFLKTDAFNTMRQDAEASRRKAMAL